MPEGLAEKITRFRRGMDDEEATADDNIFESIGTISAVLSSAEDLSVEDMNGLDAALAAGILSVRSDNFMGRSIGRIKNSGLLAQVTFVFNRDKTIRYWKEK